MCIHISEFDVDSTGYRYRHCGNCEHGDKSEATGHFWVFAEGTLPANR
jgi:hypothetical protein